MADCYCLGSAAVLGVLAMERSGPGGRMDGGEEEEVREGEWDGGEAWWWWDMDGLAWRVVCVCLCESWVWCSGTDEQE